MSSRAHASSPAWRWLGLRDVDEAAGSAVVEMRQTLLFAEADVFDEGDRLVARASSTCMPRPEVQNRD